MDKFTKIINYSKEFLKRPSKNFFSIKPILFEKLINHDLYHIKVNPLKGKQDIVGCKILKTYDYIGEKIKNNGFSLKKSDWDWRDSANLYYLVKKQTHWIISIFIKIRFRIYVLN